MDDFFEIKSVWRLCLSFSGRFWMEPPCVKWRGGLQIAKHISPRDLFVGILRGVKIPWGFCVESDKGVTEGYHHVTPQKINMERKDHTVGKENHLNHPPSFWSSKNLHFPACCQIKMLEDEISCWLCFSFRFEKIGRKSLKQHFGLVTYYSVLPRISGLPILDRIIQQRFTNP